MIFFFLTFFCVFIVVFAPSPSHHTTDTLYEGGFFKCKTCLCCDLINETLADPFALSFQHISTSRKSIHCGLREWSLWRKCGIRILIRMEMVSHGCFIITSWDIFMNHFLFVLVCISILHEPGDDKWGYEKASERWLPVHTVETIIISVISMLAEPNDESPANVDAAKQWREAYPEFKRRVARCVRKSQEE